MNLIAPVELSFYIFQSSTHLNDVYRKGMSAERNFLRYAAFVSFFPTILSGPIQKARDILPQFSAHSNTRGATFEFDKALRGMLLL